MGLATGNTAMRALRTLAYAVLINPRIPELLSARNIAILRHKCQKRTLRVMTFA